MKTKSLPQCRTNHCHKSSIYLFNTLLKIYTNPLCKWTSSSGIYNESANSSEEEKNHRFLKMLLWSEPQHDCVDFQKKRMHIIFGSLAAKVPATFTKATFSMVSSHLNRPWHALFFLSYSLLPLLIRKESSGTHSNYKEIVNSFRLTVG